MSLIGRVISNNSAAQAWDDVLFGRYTTVASDLTDGAILDAFH
jgi:hypothetical protein